MNDTQDLKTKATALQAALAAAGFEVPRHAALTALSRMNGYRSYVAALRGTPHAAPGGKLDVLMQGASHEAAAACYIAKAGTHCPHCGGNHVLDDNESHAENDTWTVWFRCGDCTATWSADFTAHERIYLNASESRNAALRLHGSKFCPECGNEDLEFDGITLGQGQVLQRATCQTCNQAWTDVYRLTSIEDDHRK